MKKIILCIITVFSAWGMYAQDFYYHRGNKLFLQDNNQYMFILTDLNSKDQLAQTLGTDIRIHKFLKENGAAGLDNIHHVKDRNDYWAEISFPNPLTGPEYQEKLQALKSENHILLVSRFYKNEHSEKIGLSNYLMVKLKSVADFPILEQVANQYNLIIEGQNKFMRKWYSLSCTKNSSLDALHAANAMYETGLFEACEPDLMTDDEVDCVNDALFNNQWALQNTGQNGGTVGLDIHACNAWNTTKGRSDIIVAVLDHGFEMNHPDLQANVFGTGFDTESGTSPALVLGSHGTACAGIVGAVDSNSIGVSGVAPNTRLMSISNSLAGTTNSRIKRADGINWAVQNGAAVISNSWGSATQHQVLEDAIDSALVNGRGGLGTCIVFATGNDNLSTVGYPANYTANILAVGAMSPCAQRKNPSSCDGENWGSNYGTQLDIVAPGVLIPTTDRQGSAGYSSGNYTNTFNGTSSATPHVAGLCALILAANPCLTVLEINNIIEKTAQKVGSYTYSSTTGRLNGNWNNQMGYGLIDAEAAVELAATTYLQNQTVNSTKTYKSKWIEAGENVTTAVPTGNYTTTTSANVTMTADESITLEPGTELNGTVLIQISNLGICW